MGAALWVGHLTKPAQVCFCNEGWICEQLPIKDGRTISAVGPGMPCPRCDAHEPPRLPES